MSVSLIAELSPVYCCLVSKVLPLTHKGKDAKLKENKGNKFHFVGLPKRLVFLDKVWRGGSDNDQRPNLSPTSLTFAS